MCVYIYIHVSIEILSNMFLKPGMIDCADRCSVSTSETDMICTSAEMQRYNMIIVPSGEGERKKRGRPNAATLCRTDLVNMRKRVKARKRSHPPLFCSSPTSGFPPMGPRSWLNHINWSNPTL